MKKKSSKLTGLVFVVLLTGLSQTLLADYIYNNATNDLLTRFPAANGVKYGDEIILAGTDRFLTNFSFEFYGTNTAGGGTYSGSPEVKVRFYYNDGPLFNGYATPSNIFWESSWFPLGSSTTPRSTIWYNGSDFTSGAVIALVNPLLVVSNFTWSVEFRTLGLTDDVGLDIYSPPVVGQDFPDYWENLGSGWVLKTNSVPIDFAAQLEATIPEPASILLSGFVGLGLLFALRRRSTRG